MRDTGFRRVIRHLRNKKEREILEHSLKGSSDWVYRNYFAADPASPDGLVCLSLVEQGFMVKGRTTVEALVYFHVTQAGAEAVGLELPHE